MDSIINWSLIKISENCKLISVSAGSTLEEIQLLSTIMSSQQQIRGSCFKKLTCLGAIIVPSAKCYLVPVLIGAFKIIIPVFDKYLIYYPHDLSVVTSYNNRVWMWLVNTRFFIFAFFLLECSTCVFAFAHSNLYVVNLECLNLISCFTFSCSRMLDYWICPRVGNIGQYPYDLFSFNWCHTNIASLILVWLQLFITTIQALLGTFMYQSNPAHIRYVLFFGRICRCR